MLCPPAGPGLPHHRIIDHDTTTLASSALVTLSTLPRRHGLCGRLCKKLNVVGVLDTYPLLKSQVSWGCPPFPEYKRHKFSVSDVAEEVFKMPADEAHTAVFDALVPSRLLGRRWVLELVYPRRRQLTWVIHMRQEVRFG
jgi:hypothetical protein